MPEIHIHPSGQVCSYTPGATLLDILLAEKCFVDNPCNGKGTCGKCRVKILNGNLPEPCATEKKLINEADLNAGIRLSCLVKPETDLEVELLQKERKHNVLTTGYVPDFDFDVDIRKQVIEIHKPALEDQTPLEDQIREQTGAVRLNFDTLTASTFVPGTMTAVLHGEEIIGVENGDTADFLYGVAIDIGTTTVVCVLVDLLTGKELASASMINAQKHFGLDVLTRITYELEQKEAGVANLQKAIVDSINQMIDDICQQAEVKKENIYEIAVGANCTMMHTLLGVDATSIGKAPYAPIFTGAKNIRAGKIGLEAAKGARLYCLPSVSAYIGADIVAGAYVCELQKQKDNVLFIDIGTNGEIVLSKGGELLSCSCAAGPALEGMNISSGMRAAEGAIEDVTITEEGVKFNVIGDEQPIGICGSGILAVVKELLKSGLLRKEGAFIRKESLDPSDYRYHMLQMNGKKREFVIMNSPEQLLITQGDVRQVQLAKGAILSGFIALLNKTEIKMEQLDKIMIAGQFGAHLPADSLTGTGILPEQVKDRLVYVGNSSKTGAYMALMSAKVKKEMEELASRMDYVELGATEGYERLFSDCLVFPEF